MKNKIRVYTILSCCMLGLSACQEDVLVEEVTKGNVTIIGRMSSELTTRTCVDSSSPDGEAGILWSSKDQIGVYGDKGTKMPCLKLPIPVMWQKLNFMERWQAVNILRMLIIRMELIMPLLRSLP